MAVIRFQYFETYHLVIMKFSGVITGAFLTSFLEYSIPLFADKKMERVLNDLRDADITFDLEAMEQVAAARRKLMPGQVMLSAHLVSDVKQTVLSTLFSQSIKGHVTSLHICSTTESALGFLLLDISLQQLEEMINGLELEYREDEGK
jgi:hypothetical protein